MKKSLKNFFLWSPRIIGICFILFLSLFAFDAFELDMPLWKQMVGFLIHLIPNYLLMIVLIISWKYNRIGGVIFILLVMLYIIFTWGKFDLWTYFIIAGPPTLIGFLFILQYYIVRNDKF